MEGLKDVKQKNNVMVLCECNADPFSHSALGRGEKLCGL